MRVTPRILGTSPGSTNAYDTHENVVPTSSAMTSPRVVPRYGLRVFDTLFVLEKGCMRAR
jgi:hypothetical protein